jgi:hypothetical protein
MPHKRLASLGARAVLLLSLVLFLSFPVLGDGSAWFSAHAEGDGLQVQFTPHVTQVGWTVTPQPTVPAGFGPQGTPVPLGATPITPTQGPTPVQSVSGGDENIGYDFLEGSVPPTWRIWYNGQEMIVSPRDPAESALLAAFMEQAERAAIAKAGLEAADKDLGEAAATGGFGALAAVGGTITAIISCAGVPFTFWAAGGTGWTCAGGIIAAVGGGGAVIVSAGQGIRSVGDRDQAQRDLAQAGREAGDLFSSLSSTTTP